MCDLLSCYIYDRTYVGDPIYPDVNTSVEDLRDQVGFHFKRLKYEIMLNFLYKCTHYER